MASLNPGTVVTHQITGKTPWDRLPCDALLHLRASARSKSLFSTTAELEPPDQLPAPPPEAGFFRTGAFADAEVVTRNGDDGHQQNRGRVLNREELRVTTTDGQSFALAGTHVDTVDSMAIQALAESQPREVERMEEYVNSASLFEVQHLGHPSDVARDIVRCPLCPYYSLSLCSKQMKQKKWRPCLQRHLRNFHGVKQIKSNMVRKILRLSLIHI